MSISSLTSPLGTPPSATQSNSGNGTAASGSTSIGDQLLAALAQSPNTTSTNPLLQDLVSLSPAAQGQGTAAPQTYNAQGLLQQMQNEMMLNDPLLQATGSTSDPLLQGTGATSDPLLQAAASDPLLQSGSSSVLASLASLAQPAAPAAANGGQTPATNTATTGSQTPSAAATSPNLVQLLQQNPSLAGALVEAQVSQGIIWMLGR